MTTIINNEANNTNNTEAKVIDQNFVMKSLDAIKNYIGNCIETRSVTISCFDIGVTIGRINGSYGIKLFFKEKTLELTVNSVKELWNTFYEWIKSCWDAGKAVDPTAK